ncbi:initiation-specific alpha-1,6-mannosyltransferase [Metarhizium rileyi]|uniref:Initiation-specific alpha-1,6-mannosyltransferase n=1 Tax=Metarhizium rileyi (strain RCEF 4871) TaxID=1649241 RepID=A0A166W0W4_METRR|nr:initiation-specific alpha-1,6-mannosyltransferase [Metarhizium rileyi RCEF 4871]
MSSPEPPPLKLAGSTFPQKIWQTWKIDPLFFGITETARAMTWIQQNPHMRYEVITDASDMTYVEQHFGPDGFNRPDIVEFYRHVSLRIIKADLLRYMILYAEGGIYADIDVEALKPFHRFIPERHSEQDYDLIVGVEVDMPQFRNHRILGQKSQSFCQWTIISRPRHPVMLHLIEKIMKWLRAVARKQRVEIGKVELDFDQVITGTGPSAFTSAVLEEMNKANQGDKVTWDDFHNMDESKVVGRVLVLTVEAFCAGQGHSDSGNHGSRGALVKHHYHASNWPSKHRRYRHPAYGQVEECNWDAECVEQWDKDVAAFDKLSEGEKKKIIVDRLKLLQEEEKALSQPEPEAPE